MRRRSCSYEIGVPTQGGEYDGVQREGRNLEREIELRMENEAD